MSINAYNRYIRVLAFPTSIVTEYANAHPMVSALPGPLPAFLGFSPSSYCETGSRSDMVPEDIAVTTGQKSISSWNSIDLHGAP